MMRLLLDVPSTSLLISGAFGGIVVLIPVARKVAFSVLSENAGALVGVLVSLLGFALAGMAIIISVQDRGLVGAIVRSGGKLWGHLIRVFSNSTKWMGVTAIYFFLLAALHGAWEHPLVEPLAAFLGCTLLAVNAFQVGKIVYVLERVAEFASERTEASRR